MGCVAMRTQRLGQGLEVSALGIGCMPMTPLPYGSAVDEREAIATLHRAIDLGVTLVDTAEGYGSFSELGGNELVVGRGLAGRRDEVTLCTKFGLYPDPSGTGAQRSDGRPETVRSSCDGSLKRLGVDHIDLYYQHRIDPTVPIEETWGALAELVEAGKVRFLGMCEPGLETLRRAHRVHPVAAVQNEYSLFTRDPEDGLIGALRRLGIGLVCYSPLGRGFLSGAIRSPDDFGDGDVRRHIPRFQGENFHRNLELVDRVQEFADARGVTAAEIALAWLLAQGDDVVPIPGMERTEYVETNLGAADVTLTTEELSIVEGLVPAGPAGARANESMARFLAAETAERGSGGGS